MIDQDTGEILGIPTEQEQHEIATRARVPFLRSAFNYDTDQVSLETGLVCLDASRTQQHFKEETDINTIVDRFGLTGELPKDVPVPQSGDFLDATDFHTAMTLVRQAEEAFAEMPAETRTRFNNDPSRFMAFLDDPDNAPEARKMGLLVPEKAPPGPVEVIVRPEPPAPAPPAPPGAGKNSST